MNLQEVLNEIPALPEFEDDRVRFYLDNRVLIETWAALRQEAGRAVAERMLDLAQPLQVDLVRLGDADTQVDTTITGAYRRISLTRPTWRAPGRGSLIEVALEAEAMAINNKGALRLYPCVRVDTGNPDFEEWADGLKELGSTLKVTLGRGWSTSTPGWLVWRYVVPPEGSWDLDQVILRGREDLLRLWVGVAPIIDGAVADKRPAPSTPQPATNPGAAIDM